MAEINPDNISSSRFSMPHHSRRLRIPVWFVLVALILIPASFIIVRHLFRQPIYHSYHLQGNSLNAGRGSRKKMILPDSSQVWLNADSHLTYNITPENRKVELQGEAYFVIAKDTSHIFLIHTKILDVRALEGAVNVNEYDSNSEVVCVRGPIDVTLSTAHLSSLSVTNLKIRSGDKLELNARDTLPIVGNAKYGVSDSVYSDTSWINETLAFRGDNMEKLRPVLERWYDVKIMLTGDKLKYQYFDGNINDFGLRNTLDTLQKMNFFEFAIDSSKKEVRIWGSP